MGLVNDCSITEASVQRNLAIIFIRKSTINFTMTKYIISKEIAILFSMK